MNSVDAIESKELYKKIEKEMRRRHPKYGIMLAVGVDTGLRISDILKLQVKDIKASMTITETKTKKERTVKLCRKTRQLIKDYVTAMGLKPGDYLVYSTDTRKHKALSRNQAWKIIHVTGASEGVLSLGTHSMRKTYAVNQYRLKKDVEGLKNDFGHRDRDTTYAYLISKKKLDELLPK